MKTPEDEAFDELAKKQGAWGGGFHAKRAAAADKQEPVKHWSDCAVHNEPAYPAGPCDCGVAQKTEREALKLALEVMQINLTLLEKIDPYKGQEDLLSDSLELTHEAIASLEAALAQPAQEPAAKEEIPKEVLYAISRAGMTLLKTRHGYELRNMGRIEALAQPPLPAQEPVAWTLLLVGEHHGLIGKAGEQFLGQPKHYERVDVYTAPPKRDRVLFPTMLRKMWSGSEVQAWLDENVNKEKNA